VLGQPEPLLDDAPLGIGLRLNFRNAPLRSVLSYLHEAAHLPIEVEPNVEIDRTIDLLDDKLVDKQKAISLLSERWVRTATPRFKGVECWLLSGARMRKSITSHCQG